MGTMNIKTGMVLVKGLPTTGSGNRLSWQTVGYSGSLELKSRVEMLIGCISCSKASYAVDLESCAQCPGPAEGFSFHISGTYEQWGFCFTERQACMTPPGNSVVYLLLKICPSVSV